MQTSPEKHPFVPFLGTSSHLDPQKRYSAVPIQPTPTFSAGNAVKLFDGPWFFGPIGRSYDVAADGKRFLMIKTTAGANERVTPTSITVVLNWTEELKARLPATK